MPLAEVPHALALDKQNICYQTKPTNTYRVNPALRLAAGPDFAGGPSLSSSHSECWRSHLALRVAAARELAGGPLFPIHLPGNDSHTNLYLGALSSFHSPTGLRPPPPPQLGGSW